MGELTPLKCECCFKPLEGKDAEYPVYMTNIVIGDETYTVCADCADTVSWLREKIMVKWNIIAQRIAELEGEAQ